MLEGANGIWVFGDPDNIPAVINLIHEQHWGFNFSPPHMVLPGKDIEEFCENWFSASLTRHPKLRQFGDPLPSRSIQTTSEDFAGYPKVQALVIKIQEMISAYANERIDFSKWQDLMKAFEVETRSINDAWLSGFSEFSLLGLHYIGMVWDSDDADWGLDNDYDIKSIPSDFASQFSAVDPNGCFIESGESIWPDEDDRSDLPERPW